MNAMTKTRRLTLLAVVACSSVTAALILTLFDSATLQRAEATPNVLSESTTLPLQFTDDGELQQPQGYRSWVHVGTPLTPNDMNGGKAAFPEFHSVYINPDALDAYQKTGEFPNGTVLVKELISVGSKAATSGKGYFMGEFQGLEVAVKDKARFSDDPGHWAYFSFGHEYPLKENAQAQPVANCSTCHAASAAQDFVFTQYYPVLRAARNSASAR